MNTTFKNFRLKDWLLFGLILPFLVLLAPLLLLLALVFIPYGHYRDRKLLRNLVNSTPCEKCGRILGIESLKLADEAVAREAEARSKMYPGTRFRLIHTLHAICPACGARFTHFKKDRRLGLEDTTWSHKKRKRMLG